MTKPHVDVRGDLAVHVSGYRRALGELGYSERTVWTHMGMLGHLSCWLEDVGLGLDGLTDDRMTEFLAVRRHGGDRGLVTVFGIAPLLVWCLRVRDRCRWGRVRRFWSDTATIWSANAGWHPKESSATRRLPSCSSARWSLATRSIGRR